MRYSENNENTTRITRSVQVQAIAIDRLPMLSLSSFKTCYILLLINAYYTIPLSSYPITMSSSTNNYKDIKKVAVIGATGKLGRNAVLQLSSLGIPVKCLIRNTKESILSSEDTSSIEPNASSLQIAKYFTTLPNVELIEGDVTQPDSLSNLLEGCSACLALYGARRSTKLSDFLPWSNPEDEDRNHSKQVNYQGVKNIIDAARKQECRRIIRITGKGEDPFSVFSILINLFGSMAKAWNYEGWF